MEMKVGAPVEFVWRNKELTNPPGQRPPGSSDEHRMQSRITELDPPRKLSIAWTGSGDVSFELEPRGNELLLTVIHRRLPDRPMLVMVAAGWHMHLDVLVARATGQEPMPFSSGTAGTASKRLTIGGCQPDPSRRVQLRRSTGRGASSRCTQASDANAKATASRPRR